MGLIFRNDDVSANTDLYSLDEMYKEISSLFPRSEVWSCMTLFSQSNENGSIYPNPPFKHNLTSWFYNVDNFLIPYYEPNGIKPVSHGLWHFDHSRVHYELQEASIVTSCKFIQCNTFVPPFNRFNEDTEKVCLNHGIDLIKPSGWLSLEHNTFDPSHEKWYFHSWRYTPKQLINKLKGNDVS